MNPYQTLLGQPQRLPPLLFQQTPYTTVSVLFFYKKNIPIYHIEMFQVFHIIHPLQVDHRQYPPGSHELQTKNQLNYELVFCFSQTTLQNNFRTGFGSVVLSLAFESSR